MTMVVSFNNKVSSRDEILTRLLAPSIRWLEPPAPAPADVRFANFIFASHNLKIAAHKNQTYPVSTNTEAQTSEL